MTTFICRGQIDSLKKQIVAHYSFEENILDISGHQVHGEAPFELDFSEGIIGKAIEFTMDSQRVELPHNLVRMDLRNKAISFWFKPGDLKYDHNFLLDKNNECDYYLEINRKDSLLNFGYIVTPQYGNAIGYLKIPLDQWTFVVINREQGYFGFYINGERLGELKIIKVHTTPISLFVGSKRPENEGYLMGKETNGSYIGKLDELIFYDRPLTDEEVKRMYQYRGDYVLEITKNSTFELNNILFERDKYELKEEAFESLDLLVEYLKENPKSKVKISGHTDNRGSKKHNMELSKNRAKEVKSYLADKGIKKRRIKTQGYGGSQPIADNITQEGMKRNRRVEFYIY